MSENEPPVAPTAEDLSMRMNDVVRHEQDARKQSVEALKQESLGLVLGSGLAAATGEIARQLSESDHSTLSALALGLGGAAAVRTITHGRRKSSEHTEKADDSTFFAERAREDLESVGVTPPPKTHRVRTISERLRGKGKRVVAIGTLAGAASAAALGLAGDSAPAPRPKPTASAPASPEAQPVADVARPSIDMLRLRDEVQEFRSDRSVPEKWKIPSLASDTLIAFDSTSEETTTQLVMRELQPIQTAGDETVQDRIVKNDMAVSGLMRNADNIRIPELRRATQEAIGCEVALFTESAAEVNPQAAQGEIIAHLRATYKDYEPIQIAIRQGGAEAVSNLCWDETEAIHKAMGAIDLVDWRVSQDRLRQPPPLPVDPGLLGPKWGAEPQAGS